MPTIFEGQIAVVTGSSRGIGRAVSVALAREGASVACISTTLEGSQKSKELLPVVGGARHGAFKCDISQSDQVKKLADDIESELGSPVILINNAGITKDTLLLRMSDDDWDAVISTNLKGTFLMIRSFLKFMMKARYGRIINFSSVIAKTGAAGQANYSASKAGIEGLTRSIAKEYGSRGITCNSVAPGFIETDMTAQMAPEMKEKVIKSAPAGRLGSGDDVAAAVLFLASPQASYITGQTLTVDGGLTL